MQPILQRKAKRVKLTEKQNIITDAPLIFYMLLK